MSIDWAAFADCKKSGKKRAVRFDTHDGDGGNPKTYIYHPIEDDWIPELVEWFESVAEVPVESWDSRHFKQVEDCPKCDRLGLSPSEWRFPEFDMCVDCDPRNAQEV